MYYLHYMNTYFACIMCVLRILRVLLVLRVLLALLVSPFCSIGRENLPQWRRAILDPKRCHCARWMSSEESTWIVPTPSENCLLHKKTTSTWMATLIKGVCDFYLESGVIAAGEEHLAVHVDTFHLQNLNWCWLFCGNINL